MQVTDKKSQRKFYKTRRSELDKITKKSFDDCVFENFRIFSEMHTDKEFLVYVSNDFEVETTRIIKYLLEKGCKVATPRCENGSNVMNFYYINSFIDLESGYFGILEPKNTCEKVVNTDNSICVVPAICFDKNGFRIGYGKGFYDRFFSENECFLKVGLCYNEFVIDEIFSDDNDIAVDLIITENGERRII